MRVGATSTGHAGKRQGRGLRGFACGPAAVAASSFVSCRSAAPLRRPVATRGRRGQASSSASRGLDTTRGSRQEPTAPGRNSECFLVIVSDAN